MDCDKKQVIHWMNHQMGESERIAFEAHLAGCADCQQEYEISRKVWDVINEIPEPESSPEMKSRFLGMLDAYKHSQEEQNGWWKNFIADLKQLWTAHPRIQLAYSVVLILAGLVFGYYLNNQPRKADNEMQALTAQVTEMKQMLMLSLVENPSASKRLQAIGYTEEINSVSGEVIDVLLTTLNGDPNVNVRLATLEALVKFSDMPRVREGLVQSITQQQSPLVQSAMVDVMLKLQEKRSVQPFRQLLDKNDLNQSVKTKIEKGISLLI